MQNEDGSGNEENMLPSLNPPTPETFFASDFNDFYKCCSHITPEKGLGEK